MGLMCMHCKERSVGFAVVVLHFSIPSFVMAPRSKRDVMIENNRVQKVHAIDNHWYMEGFDACGVETARAIS
jgi:hypothetical protein